MDQDIDPKFERIFLHLGRFAFSWGQLDFTIDALTHVVFHHHNNPAGHRKPPKTLSGRIPYLKETLQLIVADQVILDRWKVILDTIRDESDTRNQLLHGAISMLSDHPDAVHTSRVYQDANSPNFISRIISLDDISSASDRVLELIPKFQLVTQALLETDESE